MTGVSSMTNVTAVAYADMPLFLFHLLEFMDVDYEIDVDELNERWARGRRASTRGASSSSRRPSDDVELLTAGAADRASGGSATDGAIDVRPPRQRLARGRDEREAFYLRIAGRGRLPLPGRRPRHPRHARPAAWTTTTSSTTARAPWIEGDQGRSSRSVPVAPAATVDRRTEPFGFKML